MKIISKEELEKLMIDASGSDDLETVEQIVMGCAGSCNNASNMFHIMENEDLELTA